MAIIKWGSFKWGTKKWGQNAAPPADTGSSRQIALIGVRPPYWTETGKSFDDIERSSDGFVDRESTTTGFTKRN